MKILVVDDASVLRELFSDLLTSRGHEVVTANDGVEGVFKFRKVEVPFDAVVSDYQMPRMNGVLMLMEILKLDPNVRVVLASADPPDIRKHLPPTVKVLRKPFGNEELLGALGA
jgi:CheY-like chemotaxis protein